MPTISPCPASVQSVLPLRALLLATPCWRPPEWSSLSGILFQPDHARPRKIVLEIQNVLDVRAAPAIYGLVFIAHHADVAVRLGEQLHQLVLAAVGVLVLIDHDVAQPAVVQPTSGFIVMEQAHGFKQQIVESQGVGGEQSLLVLVPDHGQLARRWIVRLAIKILRGLFQIFGMADARQRRAVLHELLIQAQMAKGGFDERQLVFIVVDTETAREAWTNLRQRLAIAPQQPHAEGMKGGEVRRGIEFYAAQQRRHARAHLLRRLVREGDRQNGGRRHVPLRDDMRDAVSDNPGFAAARAGQNQQGPFGAGDGFTLLRVETLKKVHVREDSTNSTMVAL